MACIVCNGQDSSLYSTAGGSMLVDVCLKHAAELVDLRPLVLQSQNCRQCGHVGKCCRTRQGGE